MDTTIILADFFSFFFFLHFQCNKVHVHVVACFCVFVFFEILVTSEQTTAGVIKCSLYRTSYTKKRK